MTRDTCILEDMRSEVWACCLAILLLVGCGHRPRAEEPVPPRPSSAILPVPHPPDVVRAALVAALDRSRFRVESETSGVISVRWHRRRRGAFRADVEHTPLGITVHYRGSVDLRLDELGNAPDYDRVVADLLNGFEAELHRLTTPVPPPPLPPVIELGPDPEYATQTPERQAPAPRASAPVVVQPAPAAPIITQPSARVVVRPAGQPSAARVVRSVPASRGLAPTARP